MHSVVYQTVALKQVHLLDLCVLFKTISTFLKWGVQNKSSMVAKYKNGKIISCKGSEKNLILFLW